MPSPIEVSVNGFFSQHMLPAMGVRRLGWRLCSQL